MDAHQVEQLVRTLNTALRSSNRSGFIAGMVTASVVLIAYDRVRAANARHPKN